MAKIHGIEVRNVKKFEGVEGNMHQANIYLNGKKIGFWSQDSWGGPDIYDFDDRDISVRKFNELIARRLPNESFRGRKIERNLDILMEELVNFKLIENHFKKSLKNGNAAMVVADSTDTGDFIEYSFVNENNPNAVISKETALKIVREKVKQYDDFKDGNVEFHFFDDLRDFEIGMPFALEMITERRKVG